MFPQPSVPKSTVVGTHGLISQCLDFVCSSLPGCIQMILFEISHLRNMWTHELPQLVEIVPEYECGRTRTHRLCSIMCERCSINATFQIRTSVCAVIQ